MLSLVPTMQEATERGEIIASHTPKKLQNKALEQIVSIIVKSVFPCSLKLCWSSQLFDGEPFRESAGSSAESACERQKDPHLLDIILMSTEQRKPSFLPHKKALMEKLLQMSTWINENEWLGGQNNEIRRQIRNAMNEKLEMIDPFSFFPLFKFVLELLFALKVGGCSDAAQFPFVPRVNCELWRKDCSLFADVLRTLAPFRIEELSTHHITFGDSQPLLVVIENSPFLKRVYLRNNISEDVLRATQLNCPLINTFQMEKCLGAVAVPIDCLYKTFFHGMDYNDVMVLAESSSSSERHKQLSFQSLKCINFGRMNDINKSDRKESLSLFIYTLLHFYPHTINVISDTLIPFSPALPENLPACLRDISYNVSNCCLNGIQKLVVDNLSKNKNNMPFKCLQQAIFLHIPYVGNDDDVQELVEFSKNWMPKLGCKTLYIYTLQEADTQINMMPIFGPLFSAVGSSLRAIHVNIIGDADLVALCNIISLCPNLELLRIKLAKVHVSSLKDMKLNTLTRLTSITIHSTENHTPLVHAFIEKLIESSPELDALSLVLHDKPYEWLMTLAMRKKLNDISILRLSFQCFNFSLREVSDFLKEETVGTSFYMYLIELLPNLKVIQLGSLPHHTFIQVKQIYRKSDLQVSIWHVPAHSKDWYGGYAF